MSSVFNPPFLVALWWALQGPLGGGVAHADEGERAMARAADMQPLFVPADRVALVIGNGAYESTTRLAAPPNDAVDVASALASIGFEVELLLDADKGTMKTAIRDFGDRLAKGDVRMALAYYSGHGVQVDGSNFLIPVDADVRRENELPAEAVELEELLARMPAVEDRLNVVVLDACRNNPFVGVTRSSAKGLAQVTTSSGTLLAYATAPGMVALDALAPDARNSPYTDALLSHIVAPGQTVEEVFKQVREQVTAATQKRQIPWESTAVIGNFYFVPPKPVVYRFPAPELANLRLYSEIGGEVRLDGVSLGRIEAFEEIVVQGVLPGEYLLEVEGLSHSVILSAGEVTSVGLRAPSMVQRSGVKWLILGGACGGLGAGAVVAAYRVHSPFEPAATGLDSSHVRALRQSATVGYSLVAVGAGVAGLGLLWDGRVRARGRPRWVILEAAE